MGAAYQNILFEVEDGIATLTLNRPEKLNAYTLEMGDEIVDAFARIRADAARARRASSPAPGRGFCAGVDLDALRAHQAKPARRRGRAGSARKTSCACCRSSWSSSRSR